MANLYVILLLVKICQYFPSLKVPMFFEVTVPAASTCEVWDTALVTVQLLRSLGLLGAGMTRGFSAWYTPGTVETSAPERGFSARAMVDQWLVKPIE